MFGKILVANRGEIACRIIRTARRLGISTVAVYSEADRNALHVEMADEAIAIGPAPAAQSYLAIDRIVETCRAHGVDAVHPGYGFLSENARFAKALAENDIAFIGPPVPAIEAMGDKIESKRVAAAAGVRIVPGHLGAVADAEEAARVAADIGYPVMVKASAGGGGKGMRIARDEAELRAGVERARSEARSAFGDERVFLERFIEDPRHIEIQVLGDLHGNVIHLGERECSIQRRNQKVVEEALSSFLDAATREAMGAQAVALAKAVGYASAGTVEFIVDHDMNFYFLEMNTRLQVEHPVTELVTGIDIVEEMIRIAAGEPLRLRQADIRPSGWAVEARIYAEDPARGFLPSTGRLTHYRPPAQGISDGVTIRIDSGVVEGSEISPFYDPMIAKLCAHAPTRDAATDAMADALDAFTLDGIRHNIPFLAALMNHPRWREGDISTSLIADVFPDGFNGVAPSQEDHDVLAAIAVASAFFDRGRNAGEGGPGDAWVLACGGKHIAVSVRADGDASGRTAIGLDDNVEMIVETRWRPGERTWRGRIDGRPVIAQVRRRGHAIQVQRKGATLLARLLTPEAAALDLLMLERRLQDTSKYVLCPMPGLVMSLPVSEGQRIAVGEVLAVVEAMKMENVLRAERNGTVARILVKPGDSLAVDAVILEFA